MSLRMARLDERARLPTRAHDGDAGLDLYALEDAVLSPGARASVPTGIAVEISPGQAGLVLPRSGLAARHGISVVNGPGLIDPNYRGEIRIVLVNLGDEPFAGEPGDRIAQLLLVPYLTPAIIAVDELPPSGDDRGELGFGSSGR
jgi:dUTP pyrophosphatase